LVAILLLCVALPAAACPFCRAVSETVSDRLDLAEVVVIGRRSGADVTASKSPPKGPRAQEYVVLEVLKGKELLAGATQIAAPPLADVADGAKLLILGARDKKEDKDIYWLSPRVVSDRAIEYVKKLPTAPPKTQPVDRLAFFQEHLNDADDLIADDAYDEIARAPFADVKALGPRMHRGKLLAWVQDDKISSLRRRQYLTLLSVCGRKDDLPVLEKLVTKARGGPEGALDATAACYLTLAGEAGLPLIEKQFVANEKATASDGQAIVAALRFHGEEEKVIHRSRLLQTLRLYLSRPDWADQVMPELARWEDWSALPQLVALFEQADKSAGSEAAAFALRVPIIKYLRACPLPAARQRLAELEKSHPEVVRAADLYPFLPAAQSGGATRRTKTQKDAEDDEDGPAKEKSKSAGDEKGPNAREGVDSPEAPAKSKVRRARPKGAASGAGKDDADLPVMRSALAMLTATVAILGLVVMILFGFRSGGR
jgi:hypothetical protein